MSDKSSISEQLTNCYEYFELSERAAIDCAFEESNNYWIKTVNVANSLLNKNEHGSFLDEEYHFLVQVSNYFKDVN